MAAALLGHPGGYYQTVSGGQPGNSYTGHLVVSPPNLARVLNSFGGFLDLLWENFWNAGESDPDSYTALDFDDINLDFLLTSSELPFYNTRPYYTYHNTEFIFDTYNMYSYNTLGALETQVLEGSSGQFDAIRPTCIDGAPQYEFINSTVYSTVLPLQILYRPVVLSQTRYNQTKPALGRLTVTVQCKDYDKTLGINPYDMNEIEQEVYEAKVPLNDNGFEYPIRYVYIDVVNYDIFDGLSYFAQDLLVNESDYAIDCGNLYFTKSLEAIILEKYADFEEFLSQTWASKLIKSTMYYTVRVVFDRFVPDTTDETNSLALAQATSYAIMDYFNQYTYAEVSANMISEIAYTETLTFWSTLISAPLVYFGSWAVSSGVGKMFGEAGSKAVQAALQKSIMEGLVGTVVSPIKEVFQEIIEDGFREALIENLVSIAGGTDDLGFWLSSLSTSVREVKGALGQLTFGETNIKNTFTLIHAISSGDVDTALEIQQSIAQDLKQRQEAEKAKLAQMSFWDNILKSNLLKGLFMVSASIFFGSFSFVALSGLNKMITSSIKLSPAAHAEHASWKHNRRKKATIRAVGTQIAFSSGSMFTDRVLGQTKKPSGLDSAITDINEKYKATQNTEKDNPPLAAFLSSLNPNPKSESREILANKFNEWIEVYLLQDDRFEPFKEDFRKIQENYKKIGVQKAEEQIINQIHEILQDHPQRLRWTNMFGVVMFDPLLAFAGFPRGSVELLRNYDIAATMKSKEQIIEDIQDITGLTIDLELIHISGQQVPDGTANVIKWLEDRDFTVEDKIVVVPKIMFKDGSGLFDKNIWDPSKTSPYHPFFEKFLRELFHMLKDVDVIVSGENDPSINQISLRLSALLGFDDQYFGSKLTNMRSASNNMFIQEGLTFDGWYLSLKEAILIKHALNPQGLSGQLRVDPFIEVSEKGQGALYRLDAIFLEYNKKFGSFKNEYALEMRRTLLVVMNFFSLSAISGLSDIIGVAHPDKYYGVDHPQNKPKGIESMLSRLIVDPLKYIIHDKTGQNVAQSDVIENKDERTIKINFGGSFVLIDYKTQISISFSGTVSNTLKDFISNYFDIVKSTVDNVLSYWSVDAQLKGFRDTFKKMFYSKIFHVMSRYIPMFGNIPLDKISLFLHPDKDSNHIANELYHTEEAKKPYRSLTHFEKLGLNIINAKRSVLNELFQRDLTKTEFKYLQGEILNKINEFILTFTIGKSSNIKIFKYAYFSNVPNRDRAIIHNFISAISKVAYLEGRNIDLYGLKDFYDVGRSIITLRSNGFPTKQQKFLVKDLQTIYNKIYNLFERDFGTRDPAMIKYTKLSRDDYNKFYYYSEALRSIEELCKHEGYNFALSSIQGINFLEAIENKKELVMNAYDLKYWDQGKLGEAIKTFHRFYYLTKLLGFDPLFFAPLDEDLGTSQRHHFLAVLFRKMSSYVRDHVLTTEKLHRTYDTLFKDLGRRQTQALIEGAIAAMEELIWLRDGNGDRKELTKADFPLIKSILKKHLGSLSEKVWAFWTKGRGKNTRTTSEFLDALNEFNGRRRYIMASDGRLIKKGHQDFLDAKFHEFYDKNFQKLVNLNPELFLGSKADFRFLNFVYLGVHRFDLSKL